MCRLRNIAMHDYQESVITGQTDGQTKRQTDAGQSDAYVPLCFAGDTIKYPHLHNVKALCLTLHHNPLTILADKFWADLVYSDWIQLGISPPSAFGRQLMSKQMHMVLLKVFVQSNLSYVTLQGRKEIWSHKTGGR